MASHMNFQCGGSWKGGIANITFVRTIASMHPTRIEIVSTRKMIFCDRFQHNVHHVILPIVPHRKTFATN